MTRAAAVGAVRRAQRNNVFKSSDDGGSWTAINNGLPVASAFVLAIDPSNPAVLYAGARSSQGGGGVVLKSINGGASWTAANNGLRGFASAVVIDPSNPAIVYAGMRGAGASGDGVYTGTFSATGDMTTSGGTATLLRDGTVPAFSGTCIFTADHLVRDQGLGGSPPQSAQWGSRYHSASARSPEGLRRTSLQHGGTLRD